MPSLVIFDCDGVLVDSEPITNRLIAEDLTRHGLPLGTEQSIELFVGGTMKGVYHQAREMGADLPGDWVEQMYATMIAGLEAEVEAIPGIHQLLDALARAGIPSCIASNGPMRKMEATLPRCDLWDRFGGKTGGRIFSAHDVGVAKPDPGLFLHAAKAMGHVPETTVVIEDSASGARAARAACMRCYGFTRDTPAEKLTAHDAIPFDDMRQLPALLGLDG